MYKKTQESTRHNLSLGTRLFGFIVGITQDAVHTKKRITCVRNTQELLKQNYVLTEMSDSNRCCGFGGVTMQTEKYDFAKAAGAPKAAMIRDTKAQIVSAECSACRMQITNSLYLSDVDVQFKNPIELIAEALEA